MTSREHEPQEEARLLAKGGNVHTEVTSNVTLLVTGLALSAADLPDVFV